MQNNPVTQTSNPANTAAAAGLGSSMDAHAVAQISREFLSFRLGQEEYGIEILKVQEISSFQTPTKIANTPTFILGVVNLRGAIVPIIDLRIKFGMPSPAYDGSTVTIVLNLGARVIGVVVDSVSDVISLLPEQLRPIPEFNSVIPTDHLMAIATIDQRMLTLVDIERLMGAEDMGLMTSH